MSKSIPATSLDTLKLFFPLLDDQVQEVLRYRYGIFGSPQLTLLQIHQRLSLPIGEIHRIERAGLAYLGRLFGGEKWL